MIAAKKDDAPLSTIRWNCEVPKCEGWAFAHHANCNMCGALRPVQQVKK